MSEKKNLYKRFRQQNLSCRVGTVICLVIFLFILVGFFWTPYDPDAMDVSLKFAGISLRHPFGCDQFGRDLFSRVMKGAGTTFLIGLGTVAIGAFFGMLIGALTGYFGGAMDEVLMRINDALFAFPSILLALLMISLFGSGRINVMLSLGIAFIPSFARVVRSEFMKQKSLDYIQAAKMAGAGNLRIMFVHILPNIYPVFLSTIMIGFNNAVLAEAGLSYLGIGVKPPASSLGQMLSDAQSYLSRAPFYALAPGLVIVLMILGIALVAENMKRG